MLLLSLFNVGLILLMFVVGLLYSIHYRRDILFFLLISLFVFSLILSFYFVFFINTVHCEGIELVLWGNQESISGHVGNKFTAAERAIWVIENVPPYIKGAIVGLILSDAYLALQKGRLNAHLEFSQSTKNSGYFWFVFNLLSPIIQTKPYFNTSVRKGTQCFSYILRTPSLPFLTVLKSLFYINGIKCIPECIFDLLTPIALAHWIMGDGYWDGAGTVLCTDSFTLPEVVRLMNVLIIRYRLDCAIRMHRGQPLICIRARSIPLLRSIVLPYMFSSMLYKLGL